MSARSETFFRARVRARRWSRTPEKALRGFLLGFVFLDVLVWAPALHVAIAQVSDTTPENFKIAFIGDQGLGANARAVLNLIKREGAHAVVHAGDFDYKHNPAAWDAQITEILGEDFPYFASVGNHDTRRFYGDGGYQKFMEARMNRLGITWDGDLGVKSSFRFNGIFFVLTGPDVLGSGHAEYIKEKLAEDHSTWSISCWHKNMRRMQVGGKSDDTGWGVYEESRKGGAIIITGHEHSYSRTHLLSSCKDQTVASRSDTLILTKDLPTTDEDEGRTFVVVSGLGGKSIRDQERGGDWWASIYVEAGGCLANDPVCVDSASYGALFGVFNVNGVENLAHFYFKNIDDVVIDRFVVISYVESKVTRVSDHATERPSGYVLEQSFPNPSIRSTVIRFSVPEPARVRLVIMNLLGQKVRTLYDGSVPAGEHKISWDGRDDSGGRLPGGFYFYRLEADGQPLSRMLLLLE